MIRLALVGIGGYGWSLVNAIRKVRRQAGCRLVAVADMRLEDFPDRTAELREAGVELYADAMEMFDRIADRCDGVYIATGISSHAPLVIAAAKAGLHVHLEKPAAATVQEIDAMLDALRERERMCLVGYQAVHGQELLMVKDRLAEGRLGAVKTLRCYAGWPRTASYYARNEWAGKLQIGGRWVMDGPAMNALNHQINNMLFLASDRPLGCAELKRVRGELYAAGPIDSHDTAAIEFETAGGAMGWFLCSHCTEKWSDPRIIIETDKATVEWQMRGEAVIRYRDGSPEDRCPWTRAHHGEMIVNFVEAIRADDPSLLRCPLTEARKTIVVLDGTHESSRTIHRIASDQTRRIDEGTGKARTIVPGLDDMIRRAAEEGKLLSELPDAPGWAQASESFDVTGYCEFPQQFSAD